MPADDEWVLIFSDGTGQRGVRDDASVKNTNVFQLYMAADGHPALSCFYDPGLGAPSEGGNDWSRTLRNLWSKATGWGITANIVDCYEALILLWRPGMKIGVFGFSRGAYTARCLGGVLSTCGVATKTNEGPIPVDESGPGASLRRSIAEDAVAAYKTRDKAQRLAAGAAFARLYASEPRTPEVIGVFDTVRALGLPGVMNAINPFRHEFHDNELSTRVHVGLQALAIDENRRTFAPVLWDDPVAEAVAAGQVVEQVWFPGSHSDIGGGYEDDNRLADLTLAWMLARLESRVGLKIPLTVTMHDNLVAQAHDERTGLGRLWLPGGRTIRGKAVDVDPVCDELEHRFDRHSPRYRPAPLASHPRFSRFF